MSVMMSILMTQVGGLIQYHFAKDYIFSFFVWGVALYAGESSGWYERGCWSAKHWGCPQF